MPCRSVGGTERDPFGLRFHHAHQVNSTAVLHPSIALAWWSIAVLALVCIRRLRFPRDRHRHGTGNRQPFDLGEPGDTPAPVSLANRNYVNLFKSPVLFYFCCTVLYLTDSATGLTVWLAWAYVATRLTHSLVHVTGNRVRYRGAIFGIGAVVLCVLLGQTTEPRPRR